MCTGFRIFKLSESFWNRFKWILLDQEMNLEKKLIEKYWFFHVEKIFSEKVQKYFWDFVEFSMKKSNFLWKSIFKGNFDFSLKIRKNSQKYFWTFSKNIFSTRNNYYFLMNLFKKIISWSRRIRIKQFQNVSDSLKIRKLKDKKCSTEIRGFMVVSGVTLDLTMICKPVEHMETLWILLCYHRVVAVKINKNHQIWWIK